MFLLNRSFHFIVQRLEELGRTEIINALDIQDALGLTQEVQLGINTTARSQNQVGSALTLSLPHQAFRFPSTSLGPANSVSHCPQAALAVP